MKHLSITAKVWLAFGALCCMVIAQTVINWRMSSQSIQLSTDARDRSYVGASRAQQIVLDAVQVQQWLTDISATQAAEGYDDGFDEAAVWAEAFHADVANLIEIDPENRESYEALTISFEQFYEKGKWMAGHYISGGAEEGNLAMDEFDAFASDISERATTIRDMWDAKAEFAVGSAVAMSESSQRSGLIIAMLTVLVTVVVSILLSRSLFNSLARCVEVAEAVSAGDLTKRAVVDNEDVTGKLAAALNTAVDNTQRAMDEARETHASEQAQAADLREKVDSLLSVIRAAAEGDLTGSVGVSGTDSIGRMGDGLASFLADLRTKIRNLGDNSRSLAASSEEMATVSRTLTTNADEAISRTEEGAATAGHVISRIKAVANSLEVLSVGSGEIATRTHQTAAASTTAVQRTQEAERIIADLSNSSSEIQNVIELITKIADQTNLLALNATIEAASAGEAGKGFAVVATEVKDLAKETQSATDVVRSKTEAIQASAKLAVASIQAVAESMSSINEAQNSIAVAIDEQDTTLSEVAHSLSTAAEEGGKFSSNVEQISAAAQDTSRCASESLNASSDLARMAKDLGRLVGGFKCG